VGRESPRIQIEGKNDEQTPGETPGETPDKTPDETPGDVWEEGIRESITNNRSFISEAAAGAMP
jgi:hypothetical protein